MLELEIKLVQRFSSNMSNTRKRVSSDIQTLRSRLKAHVRVFDVASQMINNSWRNSRLNFW